MDECHFFLFPIAVGGGKRVLPENTCTQFELVNERRFNNGVVHLHYLMPSVDIYSDKSEVPFRIDADQLRVDVGVALTRLTEG